MHPFSITKNLKAALRSLRSPYHEVRFWVDAVCINQGDDTERMHQVELMRDIYGSTRRTFVWLGDLEGSSTDHSSGDCFTWSGDESDGSQIAFVLNRMDTSSAIHKEWSISPSRSEPVGSKFMFCVLSLLAQHDLHLSALEPRTVSRPPLWFLSLSPFDAKLLGE